MNDATTWVSWTAIALLCCLGSHSQADSVRFEGGVFGTTYHIEARSDSRALDRDELQQAVEIRLNEIDLQMSTWKSESEISRFNRAAANEWFTVSAETASVVFAAKEISELSNGSFDITVGPLLKLWNFGATAEGQFEMPSAARVAATLDQIGAHRLNVDTNPPRLRKSNESLEIDLSAIAKGYAVDAVCDTLAAAGADHFMVEIGGEVRARGLNAAGHMWRIGIESPTPDSRAVDSIAELRNEAMATSGDYRNFFEYQGQRYSHTIDPLTGHPVNSEVTAVTVFAKTCMEADAIATALMAMGNEAVAWSNEHEIQAIFFERDGGKIVSTSLDESRFQPMDRTPTAERSSLSSFGATLGAAAVIFGLAVFAMSIGVILSNRRIRGTCGGIAALQGDATACQLCAKPAVDCPEALRDSSDGAVD